jgi:uncharacterized phage-like protein YoqJ
MQMIILAATGHRPDKLGGYDAETEKKLIDFAMSTLREHHPSTVISGMAIGWDMAIAMAAIRLKIPFWAYLPFVGQELRWPSTTRLLYHAVLRKAQRTVVCSEGGFSKSAMQVRNMRMVDDCEHIVALWNGSTGGTANCIHYAQGQGRPYTNYWPEWSMDLVPGSYEATEDWLL